MHYEPKNVRNVLYDLFTQKCVKSKTKEDQGTWFTCLSQSYCDQIKRSKIAHNMATRSNNLSDSIRHLHYAYIKIFIVSETDNDTTSIY